MGECVFLFSGIHSFPHAPVTCVPAMHQGAKWEGHWEGKDKISVLRVFNLTEEIDL